MLARRGRPILTLAQTYKCFLVILPVGEVFGNGNKRGGSPAR